MNQLLLVVNLLTSDFKHGMAVFHLRGKLVNVVCMGHTIVAKAIFIELFFVVYI